jgi:hypothetical protein
MAMQLSASMFAFIILAWTSHHTLLVCCLCAAGLHFQRTSYPPAAAAVGSPGVEVLTSALNLWRKSVPIAENLLEPLLEDGDAPNEPTEAAQTSAGPADGAQDSKV